MRRNPKAEVTKQGWLNKQVKVVRLVVHLDNEVVLVLLTHTPFSCLVFFLMAQCVSVQINVACLGLKPLFDQNLNIS